MMWQSVVIGLLVCAVVLLYRMYRGSKQIACGLLAYLGEHVQDPIVKDKDKLVEMISRAYAWMEDGQEGDLDDYLED